MLSEAVKIRKVESWPSKPLDCYRLRRWHNLSRLVVGRRAEAMRCITLAKLMKHPLHVSGWGKCKLRDFYMR